MQTELPSAPPTDTPRQALICLDSKTEDRMDFILRPGPLIMFGIENEFLIETMCQLIVQISLQLTRAHLIQNVAQL